MIQSFSIENFKSFRRATLPLSPLTLLIGANASGKSNAIEALQLLSWLASGHSLNDLLYDAREQELSLRGGFKDLSANGQISLGCVVTEDPGRMPLSFSISLGVTGAGLRITSEVLLLGAITRYDSRDKSQGSKGDGSRFEAVMNGIREQHSEAIASHPELEIALSSMFFLDPDPRRMREYSFVQEKRLKRDGSALSSVLRQLTEEEGKRARILDFIRSLPEQNISDVSYLDTPRGEVMVQLHETFGGKAVPRDAALLSDGTLRVLAVAAALFSIPEGSVVVIEEIDNGVHPSRAEKLLSDIQKIARERKLKVLMTTHNPALLDALPLDAVPDAVACYRDPEEGDSRLVKLEDLESYPELVAQGPLGRLVTRGILDRFLKDPEKRDRALKVEKDLAWLSEFRQRVQSS
ncbi:MAG TPA: ATP-binding protein [Thermoanaerobaculia bacterium]|jgi:predicted ATPase